MWRRVAFCFGFFVQRCPSKAVTAKLQFGGLAIGIVVVALGAALAQETPNPATSADASSTSDRNAAAQEFLTEEVPSAQSRGQEVALQRRLDEVRRELLDERGKSIDRWLMVIGLVLTFFGIVIAIAGFRAFDRFRKIEAEAKESATAAKQHAAEAGQLVGEIHRHKKQSERELEIIRQVTAEVAQDEPQQASRAAEAVREDPDASVIEKSVGLAISHQGDGRTSDAVDLWRSIATIAGAANDKALQARARYSSAFLLMESDPKEAIADFNRVLELDPQNLNAYGNRGVAKAKLRRHEEAIADYDIVLRMDPNNAKAYMNRGVAKLRFGEQLDAIKDFDKAIDLDPQASAAYSNRGAVKSNLGRHQEALADHDKAIDLDPNFAKAYMNRGVARAKLGRHQEALTDHDKAIDLEPLDAKAHMNRGTAKMGLGDTKGAIADCDKAIDLEPECSEAYRVRADAKANLGDNRGAIEDYDKAIDLDPRNATAYSNRGAAKGMLGLHHEAIADFDLALELDPNHAEACRNRNVAETELGTDEDAVEGQ